MVTLSAPAFSSSGVKFRPMTGCTASSGKTLDERLALRAFCGADRSSLTLRPLLLKAARSANDFDCVFQSWKSSADTPMRSPFWRCDPSM